MGIHEAGTRVLYHLAEAGRIWQVAAIVLASLFPIVSRLVPFFLGTTWCCSMAIAQTVGAPAHPPEGRYQLTWQVPPGCPSATDVSREISELTAASPSSLRVDPIVAKAVVTNDSAGFALSLTLRTASVERSRYLGAPTCEELGHATALIVALAIDPTLLERRTLAGDTGDNAIRNACHCRLTELPPPRDVTSGPCASPVASVPPQAPPAAVAPPETPPVVIAPPQTPKGPTPLDPLVWRLGLGMFGANDMLPGPNLGVGILGGLHSESIRLDAAASMLSTTVHSSIAGRSASLALYRLAPRACWIVASATRWSAGPCATVEVGLLSGKGYGADLTTRRQDRPWLASSVGAIGEFRLATSTFLLVSADLVMPWLLRGEGFRLAEETVYQSKISGTIGAFLSAGWN